MIVKYSMSYDIRAKRKDKFSLMEKTEDIAKYQLEIIPDRKLFWLTKVLITNFDDVHANWNERGKGRSR